MVLASKVRVAHAEEGPGPVAVHAVPRPAREVGLPTTAEVANEATPTKVLTTRLRDGRARARARPDTVGRVVGNDGPIRPAPGRPLPLGRSGAGPRVEAAIARRAPEAAEGSTSASEGRSLTDAGSLLGPTRPLPRAAPRRIRVLRRATEGPAGTRGGAAASWLPTPPEVETSRAAANAAGPVTGARPVARALP